MTLEEIQEFLIAQIQPKLQMMGMSSSDMSTDLDLLSAGLIDSHGFMELISALEQRFELEINLEDVDFDSVYTVRGLADHVCKQQRSIEDQDRGAVNR